MVYRRLSWRRVVILVSLAWLVLTVYYCCLHNNVVENEIYSVEPIQAKRTIPRQEASEGATMGHNTAVSEIRSLVVYAPVEVTVANTPLHVAIQTDGLEHKVESTSPVLGKRYKMVVGILTAHRIPPTVLSLAERLVHVTNTSDYKLLVLQSYSCAGEVDTKRALERLGYTVFTMTSEYAELEPSRLRITWDDPPLRVKWRTNHVLDYANLLEKTLDYDADFVMILEDDMVPAWHALDKAYSSLTTDLTIPHHQLGYVAFYSGIQSKEPRGLKCITGNLGIEGACTLTFSQTLVPKIIAHLKSDPYANPVDMAIGGLVDKILKLQSYDRIPHLFQHSSKKSTYTESDQKKRKTEEARSIYFMYDEDNYTQLFHPSQPDGYIGCYKDSESFSDLSGLYKIYKSTDPLQLPSTCLEACSQYLYGGLQNGPSGVECRCGNEFGYYGGALEEECPPCVGGSGRCGSPGKNGIYRVGSFRAKFVGCSKDDPHQRDLEHFAGGEHTPITCAATCSQQQHRYFGVQNGRECYCGNTYGRYGNADLVTCMMPCVMDSKQLCGGSWTNTVFEINNVT